MSNNSPPSTITNAELESATSSELLALATTLGRTDLVVAALRQNAPINELTPSREHPNLNQTALHIAVKHHHIDVIRALLASSASLNIPDSDGRTALQYLPPQHEARTLWAAFTTDLCQKAARDDVAGVTALIDAGVPVNLSDSPELANTALHWASSFGSLDCVKHLLARGAKVDPVNEAGHTPLIDAAVGGHVAVVRELVASGADTGFKDRTGRAIVDLPVSDEVLGALHRRAPNSETIIPPAESISGSTDAGFPSTPYYTPGERPFSSRSNDFPEWGRLLWPRPQRFVETGGSFTIPPVMTISAESSCMDVGRMLVSWLKQLELDDVSVRLVGGGHGGLGEAIAFSAVVFLRVDSCALERADQAYSLTVRHFGIDVVGSDLAGLMYGCATLINVLQLQKGVIVESMMLSVPTCNITDWPSLRRRGLYLDASKHRMPKLETLKEIVAFMSLRLKMNQLQLKLGDNFGSLTSMSREELVKHEDILDLNEWCKDHFVELVPVLGGCSETVIPSEEIDEIPMRFAKEENGQDSGKKVSLEKDVLLDEFVPLFESEQISLEALTAKELCDLSDFGLLRDFAKSLRSRGKRTVLVFAAQLMKNLSDESLFSRVVTELPSRTVAILESNDASSLSLDDRCLVLRRHGVPFYTCSSSCLQTSLAGRLSTCLARVREAVNAAEKHGAAGIILKDCSMSRLGAPLTFLYQMLIPMAGAAWNTRYSITMSPQGPEELLPNLYDTYLFRDRPEKGILGSVAVSLSDLHQVAGDSDGGTLFSLLSQHQGVSAVALNRVTYSGLRRVMKRADRIESALSSYHGNAHRDDVDELRASAAFVSVAARMGALLLSSFSAASMDGAHSRSASELDVRMLPDGRRSDLCNNLLQAIELMRSAWVNQYHAAGFKDTVDLSVGAALTKLAEGMPYQKYLEERKAKEWVPVDDYD